VPASGQKGGARISPLSQGGSGGWWGLGDKGGGLGGLGGVRSGRVSLTCPQAGKYAPHALTARGAAALSALVWLPASPAAVKD